MESEMFHQCSEPVSEATPQYVAPSMRKRLVEWNLAGRGLSRSLRHGRPLVIKEAHGGACWFCSSKAWETEPHPEAPSPQGGRNPGGGWSVKDFDGGDGWISGRRNH